MVIKNLLLMILKTFLKYSYSEDYKHFW